MVLSSFRFLKEGEMLFFAARQIVEIIALAIAIIVNNKLLVPQFLQKRKGLTYSGLLILTVFLLALLQFLFANILNQIGINLFTHIESRGPRGMFLFNAFPLLFFVMLNLFLRIFKEWASLQEIEKKLEEAKKEALKVQLENLKAQVNPHFLFNTLNNIYSLSLFNDKRTPETILKLSDLLSYMIYECRDDKVLMENEVKFIENYTALEKLRFNENASLSITIDKNWNNTEIAPLLFAPFIENAFKHGMNIMSREPKISISISKGPENKLHFICENFTDNIKNPGPGGIGLKNVKARLNLLYPNRHDLIIKSDAKVFKVDLTIEVSKGPELSHKAQKVMA